MKKILFSVFVITAMVLFVVPQYVSAAVTWSPSFTSNTVTIAQDTFGTGKPSAEQTFSPSSGIQISGAVSEDLNNFLITSQHERGDKAYGLHSNGGRMFYLAVTVGTAESAPGTCTAEPTTDFADWTQM